MSCTAIAIPSLPDITPLTLEPPALPPFAGDLTICCKLIEFSWTPVIPLGPLVINSTVMALINAQIAIINTWLDVLAVECPRN
jgi:hypothetical protein